MMSLNLFKWINYDHVESVTGVDYPQEKEIEVVYVIGSYSDESLSKQLLVFIH